MSQEVILYESDEAATLKTVTGWVSRDGFFYGKDEDLARFRGCTHKKCSCGNLMNKGYTKCDTCIAKQRRDNYYALPHIEWDCITPVYSHAADKYFFSAEEVEEYIEEEGFDGDLMLVLCNPQNYFEITGEYWKDILPEDGEIDSVLQKKLNELNQFIQTLTPASYMPGKTRTTLRA